MADGAVAHATPAGLPQAELRDLVAHGAFGAPEASRQAYQYLDQVAFCARRLVPISPAGDTTVRFEFMVRRGQLQRVLEVDAPGDEHSRAAFGSCLAHRLVSWRFPGSWRATRVTFEVGLQPPLPSDALGPGSAGRPPELSVAAAIDTLQQEGRIFEIDPFVLVALRGEEPCQELRDEFERIRCQRDAPAALARSRHALASDYVLVSDVRGALGAYEAQTQVLPLELDQVLVPGGLGSAAFPALTLGQLEVVESQTPGDFRLVGEQDPPMLETRPLELDVAERIARQSNGWLEGTGLVKLETAHEASIRTEFWYLEQNDPAAWQQRQAAGLAQPEDRFLSLYSVAVRLVALEFDDPDTGAPILSWIDPGFELVAVDGQARLRERAED